MSCKMNCGEMLEKENVTNQLKETLEKADLTMKLYLKDRNTLGIERIENLPVKEQITKEKLVKEQTKKPESITDIVMEKVKVEEPKKSWVKKAIGFVGKVTEELVDNLAREFLKKKLKWNYSVYNDAKSAVIAVNNKDYEKSVQKGTDSILSMIKGLSTGAKKIIKNTKNTAIKEAFALGENE